VRSSSWAKIQSSASRWTASHHDQHPFHARTKRLSDRPPLNHHLRRRLLLHLDHLLALLRRLRSLVLDAPRLFVLAVQLDERVLLRDRGAREPCDLARLDAAAADLLPPRDVGAPERVLAEAREVEAKVVRASGLLLDGARRLLQCLADAGVPPGQAEILVLREDPIVRSLALQARDLFRVPRRQAAQRQRPLALGRLGHVDVAPAVALLDREMGLQP
jgi:hypothetical protein